MFGTWHKFVNGTDGTPVLWQPPNLPLLLWAVCRLAAYFIRPEPAHTILGAAATISLLVWAVLEIGWGASYFRRLLGLVVLTVIVVSLFSK